MAPGAPPAGTPSFYKKYLDGNGIPVQSSAAVADAALQAACTIVVRMLNKRDDVRQVMSGQQMRVAVIGENEVTTQVPEYANLNQMFPQQDWDRLRGVGATLLIPVSSVGEENLLCLAGDFFDGEQILVQTFATAVLLGVEEADSTFDSRLRDAYDAAIERRAVAQHVRRGERDRVLRGGRRADLVRGCPRSHAGRRDAQRDQHPRRAARLRSDAGRADRRDDARRFLAPQVPVI